MFSSLHRNDQARQVQSSKTELRRERQSQVYGPLRDAADTWASHHGQAQTAAFAHPAIKENCTEQTVNTNPAASAKHSG